VINVPTEGRGRLFKRKDGKYLIYLPKDLCEDSMFPFNKYKQSKRGGNSIAVKVSFKKGLIKPELLIEEWTAPDEGATDEESD
jgi:hypothetical protein